MDDEYSPTVTHFSIGIASLTAVAAYKVHPQFVMKPHDSLATEGDTVLLHCGANGRDRNLASPRIEWLRDGSTIDIRFVCPRTEERSRISGILRKKFHRLKRFSYIARCCCSTSMAGFWTLAIL